MSAICRILAYAMAGNAAANCMRRPQAMMALQNARSRLRHCALLPASRLSSSLKCLRKYNCARI